MITAPRSHKHPSSGLNRPSDIGVTVNINAELNQKVVNSIIECFSRDFVTKYYQGLESSGVYTAPPCFVETLPGRSNRTLPRVLLHMHAQAIHPALLTSTIYIRLCLSKTLTMIRLWSYEMFEVLLIIRIHKSVGVWGILNIRMLGDTFLYRLARAIHLKEGVQSPIQSKLRTQPPHLR